MYILTAAQSYQAALEAAELGHGYLTFALIEDGLKKGLADKDPKDGQALAREWFNYAEERVPQMQEREMQTRLLLYRRLELLQEYVLVAQDKVRIQHYVRQGAQWVLLEASTLDETVHLAAIDCDIVLRDVYDKVQFAGSDGATSSHTRHGAGALRRVAHTNEVSDAPARLPLPQGNGIAFRMKPNTQRED